MSSLVTFTNIHDFCYVEAHLRIGAVVSKEGCSSPRASLYRVHTPMGGQISWRWEKRQRSPIFVGPGEQHIDRRGLKSSQLERIMM